MEYANRLVSVSILPKVMGERKIRGNFLLMVYARSRYDDDTGERTIDAESLEPGFVSTALSGIGRRAAASAVEAGYGTGLLLPSEKDGRVAVLQPDSWFVRVPRGGLEAAAYGLGPDEARCWLWLLNERARGGTTATLKDVAERALGLRYNDRTARKAREALDGLGSKGMSLVRDGRIVSVEQRADRCLGKWGRKGRGKE
jgi:hypothetical protein